MQDDVVRGEGERSDWLALSRSEQIAWAAGLFEGEGCWNAYQRREKNGKMQVQARLAMTDEDVVDRFAAVVGFGTVRRNVIRRPGSTDKPLTEWYTQRRDTVRALIVMFLPYMGERRSARALAILDLGEAHPLNERTHCPKGHPYEGENLVLEPIKRGDREYFARRCKICRTEQSRERARRRLGIQPDRYRKP